MSRMDADTILRHVRERYAQVAREKGGCCAPPAPASGCCGPAAPSEGAADGGAPGASDASAERSRRLGYSEEELRSAPEGANMGLGCGNPQAIAALQPGETVLDLGSGGGFDCFLAARQVGDAGSVIGVDMTPEMIAKARENARKGGFGNVSFRLGEIEHLPVADASVDVVISNCVINLSPDKPAVYAEVFRVLKPGGRMAISDVVVSAPLPEEMRNDLSLLSGCVSGAATLDELGAILADTGFRSVAISPREESRSFIRDWVPGKGLEHYIVSASIEGVKP